MPIGYPSPLLLQQVGGNEGVALLIEELYQRIENDELLRGIFPHFNPQAAIPFFLQWFGGTRSYSDELSGGLLRRHQHRHISAKASGAWLRCMRQALQARGVEAEAIMRPLLPIAKAMIHSPETAPDELMKSCDAIQDRTQVDFEELLKDVWKGRTEKIADALRMNPSLARRKGVDQRTVAWVATYCNRPRILECALKAGGDPNSPACDPLHATMACDIVHLGTAVSVTALAMAKKWYPKLVPLLRDHGALDDIFTAAWLGDPPELGAQLDRHPDLIDAIDPAEDFQEVTPLCHAVAGGSLDAVKLLLTRGAEVKKHSGKLLTLAVLANRADLVKLLVEHGADVQRVDSLGRLDDEDRPVADLLIASGKTVPPWMLPKTCRPDVSSNELHRVSVLLDYGANLDDRGRYGLTALHYAVRGGKIPLIQLLLERGADPNALDEEGLTPLVHLTKTRSKADPMAVIDLLVRHGAGINARDEGQNTLLHFFAKRGNAKAVRWLLDRGADRNARNQNGKSALEVGRAHVEIVSLLTTG